MHHGENASSFLRGTHDVPEGGKQTQIIKLFFLQPQLSVTYSLEWSLSRFLQASHPKSPESDKEQSRGGRGGGGSITHLIGQ